MRLQMNDDQLNRFMKATSEIDSFRLMEIHENHGFWHQIGDCVELRDSSGTVLVTVLYNGEIVYSKNW